MYKEFKQAAIGESIWIVPYDYFNGNNKREIERIFDSTLDDNSYVIYEVGENTPVYLGYYKIDNTHITLSRLFNSLCNNAILSGTDDTLLVLKEEKCLHISDWVFDKQLRQEKMLDKIFTYITSFVKRPFILWCEVGDDILFHKVNRRHNGEAATVAYFITHFSKK